MINFENSLDPDHGRQSVGPDLDPKCLTDGIPEIIFQKNSEDNKMHEKLLSMQRVKSTNCRVNLRLILWTIEHM